MGAEGLSQSSPTDTSPSNETELSIAPGSENANGDGKKSMEMKKSVQEEPNTPGRSLKLILHTAFMPFLHAAVFKGIS